jgi:hypothetical protein
MAGPRFRTNFFPVSFYLGVRAGPIVLPSNELRFGITGLGGADVLFANDRLLAGLAAAYDLGFGGDAHSARIFMNLGWRF